MRRPDPVVEDADEDFDMVTQTVFVDWLTGAVTPEHTYGGVET